MPTLKTKTITWPEAIEPFDAHLRALGCAERSVKGYVIEATYLRDYLARRPSAPGPASVTLDDLRDYQAGLLTGEAARRGKPIGVRTVARVTTQLAAFFRFLAEEELISKNPALRLEWPRVPIRAPGNVLTVKEVRSLLKTPSRLTPFGLRDRAMIELFYSTGLRRNELRALDLADVDHDEREVIVQRGKGGKGRVVPLTRSSYREVVAYLERGRAGLVTKHDDSGSAVFLSYKGQRLSEDAVADVLEKTARAAGINKHITPHTLRSPSSYCTSFPDPCQNWSSC